MRCKVNYKTFLSHWRVIFIISLLALLPELSYAQCDPTTGICTASTQSAFFTPASNDQSIIYMGELFGSVPPILAGTGSSLLGNLFKIFNTAIMTLGIIIAGYTTFVGILNTAGEGEMLGKGWSSIWIPIRTVAGIALLIPTASGYCVCQIFMMWLLVQGIGAADTLTSNVIDYMEKGQAVYVPGNVPNSDGTTSLIKTWDTNPITQVYEGLSCMQGLQKNYPLVNAAYVTPPTPTDVNGNAATSTTNPIYYNFTANKYTSDTPNPDGSYDSSPVSCGKMTIANGSADEQKRATYIEQGLNAIMPSLNSAAYVMVNDSSTDKNTVMSDTFNFVGSDFMNQVALTYNSYIIQADNNQTQSSDSYLDSIRAYGWITIGNLYWNMAKATDGGGISDTTKKAAQLTWTDNNNITAASATTSTYNIHEGDNQTVYVYGNTYGGQFIADLINTRNTSSGASHDFTPASDTHDYSNAANGMMAAMALDVLNNMESRLGNSTQSPMVAAQSLGHSIIYDVEALMTTFVALDIALVAGFIGAGIALSSVPFGAWGIGALVALLGTQFILLISAPFLFALYGALLTLGSILAVIIPLIPALAFFLAAIAWMVATLETIVAAPIVAVGLIHPDGQHQVWGKAEPAIMLIINMFLRPSLMVIGMAAGVILSFISVQFVNFGYEQAMSSLLGSASMNNRNGVTWVEATMFLTTYVGLILACVNKSFSVIDALPDTVMRWISGGEGTKFGGGQEAMQKLQGSQESSGQKAAGDASSSSQESGQAGEKLAKKADDGAARGAASKQDGSAESNLGKSDRTKGSWTLDK